MVVGCCLETLNCQKPMGPKAFIAMGAQTVPNFLIRMELWSAILRLPADVQMGLICVVILVRNAQFSVDM